MYMEDNLKKIVFSFSLLLVLNLTAIIINIPADQPSIQAGINVAVNTDTILVQPDTYFENINFIGKNITVASLFCTTQDTTYISQTIIDGDSIGSVVVFMNAENSNSILSGFTIRNGSGFYARGGGIKCINNSSPKLKNLVVTENTAGYGGGISCENNSNPILENLIVVNNHAYGAGLGGGLFCMFDSSPVIINSLISSNTALYGGGCYYESNCNSNLENVSINNNSAKYNGGGLYCVDFCSLSLLNVKIFENSADQGGGIYYRYSYPPILENVTIKENSATKGGGIYTRNSSLNFDTENRCNIFLNYAGLGNDLYDQAGTVINVVVDTFTIIQPDEYSVYPLNHFTFDIENSKIEQVQNDLYVNPSGSDTNSGLNSDDPLQTISFALTKINSEDQHKIFLSNGTYSSNLSGEHFPLNCKSNISIIGENELFTILDGDNLRKLIYARNDSMFSIEHLTITNGFAFSPNGSGGGIYCYMSNPSFNHISVTSNSASSGGGIFCEWYSNLTMNNITITGNSTSYDSGGGILSDEYSSIEIVNGSIKDNTSSRSGGGLGLGSFTNSDLKNVVISNNSAIYYGGGIYTWRANSYFENITIVNNNANSGGGIYSRFDANQELLNCIFYNDTPQEIYLYEDSFPSEISISFSDIEGGEDGIVVNNGTLNWLECNINENPLFVASGEFPFSLQVDSPCIDAGHAGFIFRDPEDPFNPGYALYPANGTITNDMGAYGGPNVSGWLPVYVEDYKVHPIHCNILKNYPNPFNPSTTISFSILEESTVDLVIYNIKGQKIISLLNDQISAGEHSIVWNGKDVAGKKVSSGVYLYKLYVDSKVELVKKCLLLK